MQRRRFLSATAGSAAATISAPLATHVALAQGHADEVESCDASRRKPPPKPEVCRLFGTSYCGHVSNLFDSHDAAAASIAHLRPLEEFGHRFTVEPIEVMFKGDLFAVLDDVTALRMFHSRRDAFAYLASKDLEHGCVIELATIDDALDLEGDCELEGGLGFFQKTTKYVVRKINPTAAEC